MAKGAGNGGNGGGGIVAKRGGRPIAAPVVHWGNPDISTLTNLTLDQTNIVVTAGTPSTITWGKAGAGSSGTLGNSKGQGQTQTGSTADKWVGGTGTDFFDGGAGDDTLKGGLGDDILVGGLGADRIEGTGASEFYYGALLNGFDTATAVIGANAPGGGGWLDPRDPAAQSRAFYSAYRVTITARANALVSTATTTTTADGAIVTTSGPTPVPVSYAGDSSAALWQLTPGFGISAGHAALVTPRWDPNATRTDTTTIVNSDGSTSTTTTTTKGDFVMPAADTAITDADLLLDGSIGETERFDFTRDGSQVVAGFDVLLVGMSGDGNPANAAAGAVHWRAIGDRGDVLGEGDLHNTAGSSTLRGGATFSVDASEHVAHLELTPTGSTVVLPQTLSVHYLDSSLSDAAREKPLTSEYGTKVTSHGTNDSLVPITLTTINGKTTATIGFNPDSPDIGVSYRGDILTGGDVNKLSGDGQADIFVLGTGMQAIRDFEPGIDKVQIGLAAGGGTDDLAYAVKDALEIAYRDGHKDLLLLPQNTMLWNERGAPWQPSDFVGAGAVATVPLFASDASDGGFFHFNPTLGLNDSAGLTASGLT